MFDEILDNIHGEACCEIIRQSINEHRWINELSFNKDVLLQG